MFWKYVLLLMTGMVMMGLGLSLAHRHDLEWLRVLALTVPTALAGLGAMLIKRRHQQTERTYEPDSVERALDVQARAGAYVFALVATTVAVAVGVVMPHVASWAILLGLLAAIVVGYGVSRLWVNSHADQQRP